jgi:adenosylcobinamide-phosphate synthase
LKGAALASACALDALLGDPALLPHPVRAFGWIVDRVDRTRGRAAPAFELATGALLTLGLTGAAWCAGRIADRGPIAIRTIVGASTLAARSLDDAVSLVQTALEANDTESARRAVARIVGRDTDDLDVPDIVRATLETLAESFCDGVVAPLAALRAGGCAAALAFKAISTLDSMIGHREAPYTFFGRAAARADDAANFVPARISAAAVTIASALAGGDPRTALRVAWTDAKRHASPNAGWPEAALAGALGIRLGGDNRYAGATVRGAVFNAPGRTPDAADIARGRRIVRVAAALCAIVACAR